MGRECFICESIELAAPCIAFDLFIEACRVKGVEPCTKARQLVRGEALDSLFDVFNCAHSGMVAFSCAAEKPAKSDGAPAAKAMFRIASRKSGSNLFAISGSIEVRMASLQTRIADLENRIFA